MTLAVFKLYDKRKSYDDVRSLVVTATGEELATFDEFGMGVALCDPKLCVLHCNMILSALVSPSSSGASSAAPRWTDGAKGVGERYLCQGEQQQQQQQQREPRRRAILAASVPSLAPDDQQQQRVNSIVSDGGSGTGFPSRDLCQREPPLTECRSGAQPDSYGGRQGGGRGAGGDDDGGTPVYSDLADLLFDDALI